MKSSENQMRIKNSNGWSVELATLPPVIALLPTGTEVTSTMVGRRNGIIIGYNENVGAFYHRRQYPYVILWEDGYFEVYGTDSFSTREST